ncbi:uncharacterized protein PGTG_13989 [Puccinia graminis f. sp. tritici CRL 75-36-700-3]|uniref:DNA 3'-5' helicase n=1 Tax=Puccinia graminis f. sp. tritici (strain CRL 75-36-700-3 / race SCCL) TaxID=418459 RepID=E3KTJ3_PUCGT|nr:uncharacterized protein PGTG_13989 [Puccinia graminis f. sp. tritici CRL 75-36-700-3]EFP87618.2 hypothetical protein PGTG_13989 [Puccinia graminis f. sp. tritici CRL 75-36-700-3]
MSSKTSRSSSRLTSRSSSKAPLSPKSEAKKLFKNQAVRDSRIKLIKEILERDEDALREYIIKDSEAFFHQTPTLLQVNAVVNLVKKQNTFVLSGTGSGKTRIAEMYHHLFAPSTRKATILVLNPLDSLGENQVAEKEKDGMTAISLTKMTFTKKVADKIIKGDYSFVYLSPEVFLNNGLFNYVFYKKEFQDRLALVSVDEGHMIYLWGLVAKGKAKRSSAHTRTQDRGIFRPSYGNLGARLMATYGVPVMLLSATCRPIAIKSIMKSLKMTNDNITFLRDELTRPEIRIIRVPMKCSLISANDLLNVLGPKHEIEDKDIPPTLIYSGSRHATLKVMKVVNQARGTPGCEYKPHSSIIRRYHAASGEKEKKEAVNDFNMGKFPCMSCTMALGLGQNWKRVRRVIHMGRGDPSTICQMMGRAGQDGKTGLAILMVEPHRKFGKNSVEEFTGEDNQEDDCRMDALAVTPICLRIAFSVDNL